MSARTHPDNNNDSKTTVNLRDKLLAALDQENSLPDEGEAGNDYPLSTKNQSDKRFYRDTQKNGTTLLKQPKINYKNILKYLPEFLYQEMGNAHDYEFELKQLLKSPEKTVKSNVENNSELYLSKQFLSPQPASPEKSAKSLLTSKPKRISKVAQEFFMLVDHYSMKISLPEHYMKFFNIRETIVESLSNDSSNVPVFLIPSFERSNFAHLDYTDQMQGSEYIQIVIVKANQFVAYQKLWALDLAIVALPSENTGVGYARFWGQKVAENLGLQYVWMIDDSVSSWENTENKKQPKLLQIVQEVKVLFEDPAVQKKVAILGLDKGRVNQLAKAKGLPTKDFGVAVVASCVYLNIALLKERNLYFLPQLYDKEDTIFCYLCMEAGVLPIKWYLYNIWDSRWKQGGCQSPNKPDKTKSPYANDNDQEETGAVTDKMSKINLDRVDD